MERNYDVSAHNSNNNNEYVYEDPSHLSTEDEFLTEEDEQALQEAFVFIPTAKNVWTNTNDVAPIASIIKVKRINKIQVDRPLVCPLDTGSTGTMIQTRALPPSVVPTISTEKRITTIANGSFDTSKSVELRNIQLPEFVYGCVVGGVETRLFHSPECRYDVIFGRDFLRSAQMKFCFHAKTVDWLGIMLDIKPVNHYMIDDVIDIELQPLGFYKENIVEMCCMINEELEDSEMFQSTEVLDRAYSSVTASVVVSQQTHLTEEE